MVEPTPLKNDGVKVSWDDSTFPISWESHKTCSKAPTRLKPMVPKFCTKLSKQIPLHGTLELSSWQQPKVFPSDDRGCALLPVSHLGFKVKSNAWLGLSSQQHNSLCIFQLLEQSVFGGCCFFAKNDPDAGRKIYPVNRWQAWKPQHPNTSAWMVCESKSYQNDLQNRPDKVGDTFKRSNKRML